MEAGYFCPARRTSLTILSIFDTITYTSMDTPDFLKKFAPPFQPDEYSEKDKWFLSPFFTNLDQSVYVALIFAPELSGALCSRASRAAGDLRHIYLKEFIYPFVEPERFPKDTDEVWKEKIRYGQQLSTFIDFLQKNSILDIFSNPRARSFYLTWLAQYGDDSIAQMAGMHLGFSGISQLAIKHLEDQRIGLAPIEKSTRYVNYSEKINGKYRYYTDPTLENWGLTEEYLAAMAGLFETYTQLIPRLSAWLIQHFPQEKPSVIEKKAFDTLRGLLPISTLSQVAFFGNGQAFEYMISRSAQHPLGEIRWLAERSYDELHRLAPSFLRRLKDETKKETVKEYQEYLAGKKRRMSPVVNKFLGQNNDVPVISNRDVPRVRLVEYDAGGEIKIITGMLYEAAENHLCWDEIETRVRAMEHYEKNEVINAYMTGRKERWQKVGRAFENTYNRFEIEMNIGAWRDLHRHRMLTQQRQYLSCHHGYDVPPEITDAGLEQEFRGAITAVERVFAKIEKRDPDVAQYAVTMAHRIRFMQWENLRQSFWQIELRTIPEGHPDYRHIEQEKFRLLEKIYPNLIVHMRANTGEYDFARRGQEEKIQKKLTELIS